MTNKEQALETIRELVSRFEEQLPTLKNAKYKEHNLRTEYLNPFWEALGWDVSNKQGKVQAYKEVEQEDTLKIENLRGAPDYCFRKNKDKRFFYLEAKKPIENIKDNIDHAQQTRTYGWCGNLNISILSDFEEFSLYDCTKKPKQTDTVRTARLEYMTYKEYEQNFDFLWDTFSREAVFNGSIDQFASKHIKRGKETVDKEFLISLDNWRTELAENISLRNKNHIDEDQLNFAVQHIIDRLIFLRIAEDRNIEPYGNLKNQLAGDNFYQNIQVVFAQANDRYNSGLFDPNKDQITATLSIDNKVIKDIVADMYYPKSPYLFDVISVEILGSAYEQFLGKVITINEKGKAKIDLKPEVRKAGGVYYTPQYIVDYIVENTVGKLLENKSPKEASELKICDPACGSGSFLLGAYQYLLNWHKDYYLANPSKKNPLTDDANLTTAEKKRILLNSIFGVDIDTNAVEVTKLSLLLKCMEGETQASISHQMTMFHERVLPTLDENIKSGNSLIDTDFYDGMIEFEERKIKPFSWEKAFPQVFLKKSKPKSDIASEPITTYGKKKLDVKIDEPKYGFDAVIGNPPYVKVDNKTIFTYFYSKYKHQDYQQDLYLIFLERYSDLLRKNGQLGIIIPNTWLQSLKFRNIRSYLITSYKWNKILTTKNRVFDAIVDTHVLVFEKSNEQNTNLSIEIYDNFQVNYIHRIDQSIISSNGDVINILSSKSEKKLFDKIKLTSNNLENISKIFSGITLFEKGKGKPAQTEEIMKSKPYICESENLPAGKNWTPLMRGSLMHRYSNFWNNNYWVQYGEWLAAPRDPKIFQAKEKIIVRQTGDSIIATIIGDNIICRKNLHILISDTINHKFILGVLNSKLTNFYYSQINPEKGEALAEVKKNHVEQLPFPKKFSQEVHDQVISFVDQLLKLNKDLQAETLESKREQIKRKIDHFEDKINELVYKLYDLTEEEIKIIENN
jgi:hypothetical protein